MPVILFFNPIYLQLYSFFYIQNFSLHLPFTFSVGFSNANKESEYFNLGYPKLLNLELKKRKVLVRESSELFSQANKANRFTFEKGLNHGSIEQFNYFLTSQMLYWKTGVRVQPLFYLAGGTTISLRGLTVWNNADRRDVFRIGNRTFGQWPTAVNVGNNKQIRRDKITEPQGTK